MKKSKISIVVPCYNEEESLPIFYKRINQVSKKMKMVDFEFLFIDDGSIDQTLNQIQEMRKKDPRVRYISFSRNFGKEAGMFAGLEYSTGDYVAIMDADLQDPPEMIEKMYEEITTLEYDCIALRTNSHVGYSFFRKIFTKCWYLLISKISSMQQIPGARDFRLMKRKMVDAILSMREYNRYSKGIFSFVGFHTKWIEYEAPERIAGKTKWNFWKLFRYAIEGIVSFSTAPLIFSAFVGVLFCFFAFIAILFIIIKTLLWGDPVGGWPSLACIIMFVSGIQLLFMGIIGMYLSKIYMEIKNRPHYIVKETEKDLEIKSC